MYKRESKSGKSAENLPGYPPYPKSEDIFKMAQEEEFIEADEAIESKKSAGRKKNEDADQFNPGNDLDVPGSELDDYDEIIGSEDEENNYYSLGGDNHEDLEEDKGG